MCGIAGIIMPPGQTIDSDVPRRMANSLAHRGPDDEGFLSWDGQSAARLARDSSALQAASVALIHRRLAIIDLSANGAQPMATADGRYWIVFNGMIYNYRPLREQLQDLGQVFRSESDTEVLLGAFAQWGPQCLTRLVGMFAFCILDTLDHRIFLARDFFGIKPLYYTLHRGGLAFASEIKALLQLPGMPRQANPARVYKYLRFGLSDSGDQTFFRGICALPPAHYMSFRLDRPEALTTSRYWDLDLQNSARISFADASHQLRELFCQSVGMHLRTDVPLGVALSGGIDSSAITIAAAQELGADNQLSTFSYIADDTSINEERYVDAAVSRAAALVHKTQIGAHELLADLDGLLDVQDEPFGSPSIYAQLRVFRLAHSAGMKVMLDGQGADEMLAGYLPYSASRLASLLRSGRLIRAMQFWRASSRLPGCGAAGMMMHAIGLLVPPSMQTLGRKLGGKDLLPDWMDATWLRAHDVQPQPIWSSRGRHVLRQTLKQSIFDNSLPQLLRYEDRNSMAYSIESRVPFLTPQLAEFIFSLPEEYLMDGRQPGKAVFRSAMRGIVPDAILDRKDKIGFATPNGRWLAATRQWCDSVLNSPTAERMGVLRLLAVREMAQQMMSGQRPYDMCIWRCLNLIRWAERLNVELDI